MEQNGLKYIGEFKHGEFDGFGKLENLPENWRYVGQFREDKRNG
jgi:hypothetical protein